MDKIFKMNGKKEKDIIDSVIGQLGDGIWENSPRMEKYWQNMDIEGDTFSVERGWYKDYSWRPNGRSWRYSESGFARKSDVWVINWVANKIMEIVRIERKDVSEDSNHSWPTGDNDASMYITRDEDITFGEAIAFAKKLKMLAKSLEEGLDEMRRFDDDK